VKWFPLSGTLPAMAFQEDVDALQWFALHRSEGLPVDREWAGRLAEQACG
jgi:hypothetical protein